MSMQENQVADMIHDDEDTESLRQIRLRNDILQWRKFSRGTYWIDARSLKPADGFDSGSVLNISSNFKKNLRILTEADKVVAIEPPEADFQISKTPPDSWKEHYGDRSYLVSKDCSSRLECWGGASEVRAAQNAEYLFPVELFRFTDDLKPLKYLPMIERSYARQPPALLSTFQLLWEKRPGSATDQIWQTNSMFKLILDNAMPSNATGNQKQRIQTLFSHHGILERLKSLADECPFLWHSIKLENLCFLGPLIESCPEAIQNYLDHILAFWRSEILIGGIQGAIETLSKSSVSLLSGACPHIAEVDREKISSLSKTRTSPFLIANLENSNQRILTLRTFFKEIRLLDSARETIAKFTTSIDKKKDEKKAEGFTSMIFIADSIVLAQKGSRLARPLLVTLAKNPRQYVICLLSAMQFAGRRETLEAGSRAKEARYAAATAFVRVVEGATSSTDSKQLRQKDTSFRYITAPGSEIWREIKNLADFFELDHLIDVYDQFKGKPHNWEIGHITASFLIWETVRCFFSKPAAGSDPARLLRRSTAGQSKTQGGTEHEDGNYANTTADASGNCSESCPELTSGSSAQSSPFHSEIVDEALCALSKKPE